MSYIVMSSAAKMPGSCKGVYKRVAVMEVEPGAEPKMISERAKGVIRVVQTWENLNVGKTDKCAYSRALRVAEMMAKRLTDGGA
jgi:hypothetical protein